MQCVLQGLFMSVHRSFSPLLLPHGIFDSFHLTEKFVAFFSVIIYDCHLDSGFCMSRRTRVACIRM